MVYTISNISTTFLFLISILYLYFNRSKIPKGLRLPPGPPRKPIFGNFTDLLTGDKPEYLIYAKLAKKYGDLVYLNVFGTSMLFVNSYEMAYELLDKRGSIYSDRTATPMLHELTCLGHSLLLTMPYTNKVTQQRAIIHDLISAKKVPEYWNMLEETAKAFLCDLNADPDNVLSHIRHVIGGLIMEITYGIKIQPNDDPYIELAEKTLKGMTKAAIPGTYAVDIMPMLKYLPSWFPGFGFATAAAELNKLCRDMLQCPFEAAEELFKSGQAKPSFVTSYLERLQVEPSSVKGKETIQQVATMLYFGGIDTLDAALQSFFLAMALHPEKQRKAQEELDRVVGKDNLPSFCNKEDLPYLDAICKEIHRWHPVAPVAMPHRLMQDDVFGEYFIPKGTMVFGHTRYLLHSPEKYGQDVDKFRPERFLEKKLDYPDAAFVYGRRVCPAKYFADASIFIMIACTLHIFKISAYDDKELRSIFEDNLFDKGVLSRPSSPFRCKLEIRPGLEKTIQQILIR